MHANVFPTVCGSLADGDERFPRPNGELCQCEDGWGGINCNGMSYPTVEYLMKEQFLIFSTCSSVCETNKACASFSPLGVENPSLRTDSPDSEDQDDETNGMVCYKGGLAIQQNHQMCDVTSEWEQGGIRYRTSS